LIKFPIRQAIISKCFAEQGKKKMNKPDWICLLAFIGIILGVSYSCNNEDDLQYDLNPGTLTDIDGNTYRTVIIGTSEWMAENLKVTNYNDGRPIGNPGKNNAAWESNSTGAYSWYNNDEPGHKDKYGALYNWHAVNTGKLCPAGWRVPHDEQWTGVNKYLLTKTGSGLDDYSETSPTPENILTSDFNPVQGGARFSGLPGGAGKSGNGYFYYIDKSARWWTSTEHSAANAIYRSLYPESPNIYRSQNSKETGFSVRCYREAKRK
jgi:uncharacterized protein (TIGR02145 family)